MHQTADPQAGRQKVVIFIIIGLSFLFVVLRLNLHPGYTDEGFQPYYDELCQVLQGDADADDLYQRAKKELRRTGTQTDVMFYFQFIGIYTGNMETPANLIKSDGPIREAVVHGEFDLARQRVQDALLDTDEMTDGRAKAWGKLIRELRVRWDNDCIKPATEDERDATPS